LDKVILYVIGHPAWLQKSQAGKTNHGEELASVCFRRRQDKTNGW
jgi:hypothetical protein